MTRRQLFAVDVARAVAIGAVAACAAVALAFALSPLTPIGLARDLEPMPGFALDVPVLALGGAGVVFLVVFAGAFASLQARTAHRDLEPRTGCPPADALARWGLPPTAVSGVQMALARGRGTTAVPIGGTLLGAIASVAVVAVALTFTASMDHLFSTPRLYGQNWDYRTNYNAPSPATVRADPGISDAAEGSDDVEIRLNGRTAHAVAMDDIKGRIGPVVTTGRAPERLDEILLASRLMDRLGLHIGDTVEARDRHSVRMRIVGRGVLPENGVDVGPRPDAAMTFQAYKRLNPTRVGDFEARIAPGAGKQATLARLERQYAASGAGAAADRRRLRGGEQTCRSSCRRCSRRSPPPCSLTRSSRRSAAPPPARRPEDAGLRPPPAARHGRVAGDDVRCDRARRRPSPRGRSRSLGLVPVRGADRGRPGAGHAAPARSCSSSRPRSCLANLVAALPALERGAGRAQPSS